MKRKRNFESIITLKVKTRRIYFWKKVGSARNAHRLVVRHYIIAVLNKTERNKIYKYLFANLT